MILITTFLWESTEGELYTPQHVLGLKRMLTANLTRKDWRFLCIAEPRYLAELESLGIEARELWPMPEAAAGLFPHEGRYVNCFVRLGLYGEPGAALATEFTARKFLVIDLDTIIRDNVDELVGGIARQAFRMFKPKSCDTAMRSRGRPRADSKHDEEGRTLGCVGCFYGGTLGGMPRFWRAVCEEPENVERATRIYVGSDQALLAFMYPGAPSWDERHGIALAHEVAETPDWRVLCFNGDAPRKPWNDAKWARVWYELAGLPAPEATPKPGRHCGWLRMRRIPH